MITIVTGTGRRDVQLRNLVNMRLMSQYGLRATSLVGADALHDMLKLTSFCPNY
jgi:hypothetical protein